ncbi:MAG: TRAP transporter large permease subunit [Desulfobacterales bacterium]|nr:TRAP transporter large permease subunit [Desulfobacterales bacterium]
MSKGARGSMEIAATCAAAGIIVGILTQTGLGTKFAMIIFNYSGGNLYIALIFTMVIAIVLGMGMPTTAAYAICASVLAPALIQLKVPEIAAHLFIFYFACLSALTPPVALASFAAAAIANAKTLGGRLAGHAVCHRRLPDPLHVRARAGHGAGGNGLRDRDGRHHRHHGHHRPRRLGAELAADPLRRVGAHRPVRRGDHA